MDAFEIRSNLIWDILDPVKPLPLGIEKRKLRDYAIYPTGPLIYRLQFNEENGQIVTYVGETENGISSRLIKHLGSSKQNKPIYAAQRRIQTAVSRGEHLQVAMLSKRSTIRIGTQSRALSLKSADERLLLEAILALAARELGAEVLNTRKKNRSERLTNDQKRLRQNHVSELYTIDMISPN